MDKSFKIAIGSDHAGFELKNLVLEHLKGLDIEVKDFGTYTKESCDYPKFAFAVANAVADKEFDYGILVCGTGIGMDICANKVKGIRAALCNDTFSAHSAKEHNNSNVLCLAARVTGSGLALDIVDVWLKSEFGNEERHIKRVKMME